MVAPASLSARPGTSLIIDDVVKVGDYIYKVVEKNDIQNLGIAFEISLEIVNEC